MKNKLTFKEYFDEVLQNIKNIECENDHYNYERGLKITCGNIAMHFESGNYDDLVNEFYEEGYDPYNVAQEIYDEVEKDFLDYLEY